MKVMAFRSVVWVGSSRDDLRSFSKPVRRFFGRAIFRAQQGLRHPKAKPLKGFGGAGVLEVVSDVEGDTYRAIYTVKLAGLIYVLHCFQKKATKGVSTPKREMELTKGRLALAEADYAKRQTLRRS
jgi:phage-related protein